jgi:hypothetical protein
MTIEITYDQAVDLLKRAVAEKGADYVYSKMGLNDAANVGPRCVYTIDSDPSCIVGHVLVWSGVDPHAIPEGTVCRYLLDKVGVSVNNKTLDLLREAQAYQDGGRPWGESVDHAIRLTSRSVAA